MASLQHADLEPASHGKITFDASAGLHKWAFTDASPLQVDLDASQIGCSGPGEAFRAASAGDGHAGGERESAWHRAKSHRAQGNVSLTHITAYDQPVTSATLTFAGTGDEVHGDLGVQLPAGRCRVK